MKNPLKKKQLDEDLVREDMFYDICSSSGWSREEIDEMGIEPEDLDIDEWSVDEFINWLGKWLSKVTGYYVEWHPDTEVGDYFSFHNAIHKILCNMVAITEKGKEKIDELEQNHVVPVEDIDKTLDWASWFVIKTAKEIPEMKLPDEKFVVM